MPRSGEALAQTPILQFYLIPRHGSSPTASPAVEFCEANPDMFSCLPNYLAKPTNAPVAGQQEDKLRRQRVSHCRQHGSAPGNILDLACSDLSTVGRVEETASADRLARPLSFLPRHDRLRDCFPKNLGTPRKCAKVRRDFFLITAIRSAAKLSPGRIRPFRPRPCW
jgi:hypothetical protein